MWMLDIDHHYDDQIKVENLPQDVSFHSNYHSNARFSHQMHTFSLHVQRIYNFFFFFFSAKIDSILSHNHSQNEKKKMTNDFFKRFLSYFSN